MLVAARGEVNKRDLVHHDKLWTEQNRATLLKNDNLLLWYKTLYERQFAGIAKLDTKTILEVGSGASPMRLFYGNVTTCDILELDHLDHSFDCHEIHNYHPIPDGSVDIITMTNVLHHLRSPIEFLNNAAVKLKPGGSVIMTEPYFSFLSKRIYKYLHHEPSVFEIAEPELENVQGPLSSANMAIPYLIFFSQKGWDARLRRLYDFSPADTIHFSSISYMATGGISRKLPIPRFLYRQLLRWDLRIASKFPRALSSFFILKLTKK